MKLDATQLRYLTKEDFRLLSAVETGSRNHEIVPIVLAARLARLKPQTCTRQLQSLARDKLVSFEADSKYEGVRLTYGGYDFLALKAFCSRGSVESIGRQMGVGKESDIYLVHGRMQVRGSVPDPEDAVADSDPDVESEVEAEAEGRATDESPMEESPVEHQDRILKIQRLGRTSFRTVKTNRDYHRHRSSCSWLYLSRLAAGLEYRFMRALHGAGLPVPRALDWNRHCVVMEWIQGSLLDNVHLDSKRLSVLELSETESDSEEEEEEDGGWEINENRCVEYLSEEEVPRLYVQLMGLILKLAGLGLIHGDFNEFNLLLRRDHPNGPANPVIIDFPQMVSIDHQDANAYYERDVQCIRTFFAKRFDYAVEDEAQELGLDMSWESARLRRDGQRQLDVELRASGCVKPMRRASRRAAVQADEDSLESTADESATEEDTSEAEY